MRLPGRLDPAARALLGSLRRDPGRRRDPAMALVALGLGYPYRHWLAVQRRARAARRGGGTPAPGPAPSIVVVLPTGPGRDRTMRSLQRAGIATSAVVAGWDLPHRGDDDIVVNLRPGDTVEADLVATLREAPRSAAVITWDSDTLGRVGSHSPTIRPLPTPEGLRVGNPWGRSFAFRVGAVRPLLRGGAGAAPPGSTTWCRELAVEVLAAGGVAARVSEVLVHEVSEVPGSGSPRSDGRRRRGSTSSVGLVVPTRGDTANLARFFAGLDSADPRPRVVVVDNSEPRPELEDFYREWGSRLDLRVLHTDPAAPFNYSAANNLGASVLATDVLAFCNDDLEVLHRDWLDRLTDRLGDGVGVVGPQLRYGNGTIQHGGVVIGLNGLAEHAFVGMDPQDPSLLGVGPADARIVSAVTGACLVTTTEVFSEVGGFDEELVLTGSDVWFCLEAGSRGWATLYDGTVALLHHESVTRGATNHVADVVGSEARWGHLVDSGDPFWSPELAIDSHVPRLRRPEDTTSRRMLDDWIRIHSVGERAGGPRGDR